MRSLVIRLRFLFIIGALIMLPASAQNGAENIRFDGHQVYADLPSAPLVDQLLLLTEAAGLELSISGDLAVEADLYANGVNLYQVVDHLLPEGVGFVLEMDRAEEFRRLIVFSHIGDASNAKTLNERQRYLSRQVGLRDGHTAEIMRETLSDRSLQDSRAKLIAIEQLSDMNSEDAWESLQSGMGDPNPEVRLATARALYRLQGDDAIVLIGQIYYAEVTGVSRQNVASIVMNSPHPLARSMLRESGLKQ